MDISEKVQVVNALMQEDRAEIRMTKGVLVNTSYFAVSGIIAVAAFAISKDEGRYLGVYLAGIWSFFLLYLSTYIHFWLHLRSLRCCLDIREAYFKDSRKLEHEYPFNPLKPVAAGQRPSISGDYLLFLPAVVFILAFANTSVLIHVFQPALLIVW